MKSPAEYTLVGKKVVAVRNMTKKELRSEGWDEEPATAIQFDDGTIVYASRDDEGNGPGAMFGKLKSGQGIYVSPMSAAIGE